MTGTSVVCTWDLDHSSAEPHVRGRQKRNSRPQQVQIRQTEPYQFFNLDGKNIV